MPRGHGSPWKMLGALALVAVLSCACAGGVLALWAMLGSPWPIDLSDFAE